MFRFSIYYLIFITFQFASCKIEKRELTEEEASKILNKEILKDVTVLYSDSGNIQIKIIAPTMVRYLESSNTKEEFPDGFFARFYDDQKSLINTLSSKYAIRQSSEGKTIMRDSVVFANINQEIIKTSELHWDERQGKLLTDKFVRVIRKDEIIQGYGFETDQAFKSGFIHSVDGQIPSKKLINTNEEEED